ncbi:MAG: AI-2E family transporter [Bacteroidia bacterium]|jgi:predicted PurR-regulated permease PerM|nr:AI-2E family transporter [Bacteroidia bacterium]
MKFELRKHPLFILLVSALVLVACWYLRSILLYVIIAAVIAMVVAPLDKYLERVKLKNKKIPRSIRALVLLFTVYAVLGALVAIFIPLIIDEVKIISTVDKNQLQQALHEPLSQLESAFSQVQQNTGTQEQTLEQYVQEQITAFLGVTKVSTVANSVVSMLGSLITGFFVISFLTFFFLKDGPAIFNTLMLLVPKKYQRQMHNVFDDTRILLTKYFTAVLLDILFVAVFVSIGMALLGVRNAIIIGLFAGVMNIIPYVGPLIGGAFAVVVGISTNLHLDFYTGMLPLAAKIMGVFVAMNLTDGFLVQPYIFSNSVKAHPIEIFIVILIAGTLAGIGGMVVAVPAYTVLRIIAKEFFSGYQFVQRLTDDLEEITNPEAEHDNQQKQ